MRGVFIKDYRGSKELRFRSISTSEQESRQESFTSTTSANSIGRDRVGIYDSHAWQMGTTDLETGPAALIPSGSLSSTRVSLASISSALVKM